MGMLTKKDLNQIGRLLDEKHVVLKEEIVSDVVGMVGEMISEQVFPRFDSIETRLTTLETKAETLPDKDYLDRKLAPINGKINVLVDVLHQNKAISDGQKQIVLSQA